jgi:spore coat protein U-like protein
MESQEKYLTKVETNVVTIILLQCARNLKIMETLTKVVKIVNAIKCMWFTAGTLYWGSVILIKSASFSTKKIYKRNPK